MNLTTISQPSLPGIAQPDQLEQAVESAFGPGFVVWQRRAESAWLAPGWNDSSPSPAITELLEAASRQRCPQISRPQAAAAWLALPLVVSREQQLVALGECGETDVNQLLRQADTFLEMLSLKQRNAKLLEINNALTLQVTESFEELSFVRALAKHLQLPGSGGDRLYAAPEILEKLRLTIRAEALGLVLADVRQDTDSAPSDPAESAHADSPILLPPLWAHHAFLDDGQCRAFVERFRDRTHERPLIMNHVQSTPLAREFPQLRQFVIVQVGQEVIRGWIIALNRVVTNERSTSYRVSEQEFGTVEATLMQSAAASLATYFHNLELLRQKEELFTEIVRALVNAVEARDPYTCGHSERVALYARRLGEAVGLDGETCDHIYLSGLLHDVGKIGVSDATLRKPGKLTDEEFQEISRHPDQGWAILHNLQHLKDIMPGVLYHHERFDGKGYPLGLAGDAIPLEGRIMAVCDAYDAMTSDRPYRQGMSQEDAETILARGSGAQWDPALLQSFFAIMPDIIQIRNNYQPRTSEKGDSA